MFILVADGCPLPTAKDSKHPLYNIMRTLKYIFAGAVTIITILSSGCKKDDKKEMEMPPMEVNVAEVQEDSIMIYKEYPGRLLATSVVDVVCRVNGTLLTKTFTDGAMVQKGQLLYTIDDTQYRNAVQQMEGELENAISANEYNHEQYMAMQRAIEQDAVSRMELLQSKSSYESGLASIKTAKANLQTAQTNLGYCRITAPITGRITNSNFQPGQEINGSAAPVTLATMYQNNTFYAEFYVEDATFYQIAGANASEVLPGYETIPLHFSEPLKHEYVGKFHYVAPDINTSTGTMLIQAEIANDYDELRDGMFVTISLPFQNDPHAILIEDAAIGTDQQGKYVYVVNDNDEVVYTHITIGELTPDNRRVVTSGLKPGQRYVTKALLKVKNGVKVKPVTGSSAAMEAREAAAASRTSATANK